MSQNVTLARGKFNNAALKRHLGQPKISCQEEIEQKETKTTKETPFGIAENRLAGSRARGW